MPYCLKFVEDGRVDWEERRRHLVSRPAAGGLAAMANSLAAGARAVRGRRFGGGLATSTHAVDLVLGDGTSMAVVLKRYRAGDTTAALEWERLQFAERIPVPTPRPLLLDVEGEWFGTPALVTDRVAGRPFVQPRDLDTWLGDVAAALSAVHATSERDAPPALHREHRVDTWTRPTASLGAGPLYERALDAIDALWPGASKERVVGHGDFHPGNLLWRRGRLTGVVDWSAAKLSPQAYEVAYCRADLTVLFGSRVADAFLTHYERCSGYTADRDLLVWDLLCAVNARQWSHLWLLGYAEQGLRGLTVQHVRRRLRTHVERVLART